jgi:hypothetical protein
MHHAGANDVEVAKPRGPRLRCHVLLGTALAIGDGESPRTFTQRDSFLRCRSFDISSDTPIYQQLSFDRIDLATQICPW